MALKIDHKPRFPDGEFSRAARNNTGIASHHTVGGTASAAFDYRIDDTTKAGNCATAHAFYSNGSEDLAS